MRTKKPVVYVASPYTKGDPAINTHFQCRIFDELLTDGKVLPVVPLISHFQHLMFPRDYHDWINYDLDMIPLYAACLRLKAEHPALKYLQAESSGADGEEREFKKQGKPVFYDKASLYDWADKWQSAKAATDMRIANAIANMESICLEAHRITNSDRQKIYGHPMADFSRGAKLWAAILGIPEVTPEQYAMCMIAVKLARLCNTPNHRDSCVDIAGYANTLDMIRQRREECANQKTPAPSSS